MDNTAHTRNSMDTIKVMNRCRTASWNEPAFRQCIHPGAVAIVPITPGRLQGRDAYGTGWRGFL